MAIIFKVGSVDTIKNKSKQIRFATMLALNESAKLAKDDLVTEMKRVFRNPVPFTLKAPYVKPASIKLDKLEAQLRLRDWAGKGTAANDYLYPEIYGGERNLKRMEVWLRSKGILPNNMFVVPGAGAKRNRYGNIDVGQVTAILSILQAHPDRYMNTTERSRKRNKKTINLFYLQKYGRLPAGIYQRVGANNLKPLIIFISKPQYKTRLRMKEKIENSFKYNFERVFTEKLDFANRTAISTTATLQ